MMPLYVHFGAGNIGRALAGPIFSRAGYQVLFVDAVPEIVRALHERREYRVVIKDTLPPGTPDSFMVTGVDGIDVRDQETVKTAVARADLIGTAVGAAHLPSVLNAIAAGLPEREGRPVSLLFCENLHGLARMARETLSRALPEDFPLDQQVGLVETSIGKMVPLMPQEVRRNDPLEVWGEAYNAIIADRNGFVGPVPDDIEGLLLKQCFQAYVDRKLYIHNLGHATCAYHGYLRGHALIDDAMCDPAVLAETEAVMQESARALARRYPQELDAAGLAEHVADLLRRFGNQALGDTVFRVGRDLRRKLAPGDRMIGGLRLVQSEQGTSRRSVARSPQRCSLRRLTKRANPSRLMSPSVCVSQRRAEAVLCAHSGLDPMRDAAALR